MKKIVFIIFSFSFLLDRPVLSMNITNSTGNYTFLEAFYFDLEMPFLRMPRSMPIDPHTEAIKCLEALKPLYNRSGININLIVEIQKLLYQISEENRTLKLYIYTSMFVSMCAFYQPVAVEYSQDPIGYYCHHMAGLEELTLSDFEEIVLESLRYEECATWQGMHKVYCSFFDLLKQYNNIRYKDFFKLIKLDLTPLLSCPAVNKTASCINELVMAIENETLNRNNPSAMNNLKIQINTLKQSCKMLQNKNAQHLILCFIEKVLEKKFENWLFKEQTQFSILYFMEKVLKSKL